MYKAHFNNVTMSIKDFLDMFTNQLILNDDIWIYDEDKEFPCLALLTNCNDTVIHYFKNADDCGSISLNKEMLPLDEYTVFGDIKLDKKYIIDRSKAVNCITEFIINGDKPSCINWFEL